MIKLIFLFTLFLGLNSFSATSNVYVDHLIANVSSITEISNLSGAISGPTLSPPDNDFSVEIVPSKAYSITIVRFEINAVSAGAILTATIRSDNGSPDTILATATPITVSSTGIQTLSFLLPTPYTVSAGVNYWLTLHSDFNSIITTYRNGNSYPSQEFFNNSSWQSLSSSMAFAVVANEYLAEIGSSANPFNKLYAGPLSVSGTLISSGGYRVTNVATPSGTLDAANKAYVDAAVPTITANSPLSYSGGTLSIPVATSGVNGYLSSTDWSNFNNKLSAISLVPSSDFSFNPSTITSSGTISLGTTGVAAGSYTTANITVDSRGRITAASSGASGSGTVTTLVAGTGISLNPSTITSSGTISGATATNTVLGVANFGSGLSVSSGSVSVNASTINFGSLAIANGGLNRTTVTSSGNFPISDGTNYIDGTISAGTGISVSNSGGSFVITNTASATNPTVVSTGTNYVASLNTIVRVTATSSVTITLPSASGNDGNSIRIRNETTNTNKINPVAIAPNAADNINGSHSNNSVNTYGEDLILTVAGTNWIGHRFIPGTEISLGTMQIGAVTTAPTKGTAAGAIDSVTLIRSGGGNFFVYRYAQSNTAGSAAGSGVYKPKLPASLSFDTTNLTVSGQTVDNIADQPASVGTCKFRSSSGPTSAFDFTAYAFDSSTWVVDLQFVGSTTNGYWNNSFFPFNQVISFTCWIGPVAINGWNTD